MSTATGSDHVLNVHEDVSAVLYESFHRRAEGFDLMSIYVASNPSTTLTNFISAWDEKHFALVKETIKTINNTYDTTITAAELGDLLHFDQFITVQKLAAFVPEVKLESPEQHLQKLFLTKRRGDPLYDLLSQLRVKLTKLVLNKQKAASPPPIVITQPLISREQQRLQPSTSSTQNDGNRPLLPPEQQQQQPHQPQQPQQPQLSQRSQQSQQPHQPQQPPSTSTSINNTLSPQKNQQLASKSSARKEQERPQLSTSLPHNSDRAVPRPEQQQKRKPPPPQQQKQKQQQPQPGTSKSITKTLSPQQQSASKKTANHERPQPSTSKTNTKAQPTSSPKQQAVQQCGSHSETDSEEDDIRNYRFWPGLSESESDSESDTQPAASVSTESQRSDNNSRCRKPKLPQKHHKFGKWTLDPIKYEWTEGESNVIDAKICYSSKRIIFEIPEDCSKEFEDEWDYSVAVAPVIIIDDGRKSKAAKQQNFGVQFLTSNQTQLSAMVIYLVKRERYRFIYDLLEGYNYGEKSLIYYVIVDNELDIGKRRTIAKHLAEGLSMKMYWLVDGSVRHILKWDRAKADFVQYPPHSALLECQQAIEDTLGETGDSFSYCVAQVSVGSRRAFGKLKERLSTSFYETTCQQTTSDAELQYVVLMNGVADEMKGTYFVNEADFFRPGGSVALEQYDKQINQRVFNASLREHASDLCAFKINGFNRVVTTSSDAKPSDSGSKKRSSSTEQTPAREAANSKRPRNE